MEDGICSIRCKHACGEVGSRQLKAAVRRNGEWIYPCHASMNIVCTAGSHYPPGHFYVMLLAGKESKSSSFHSFASPPPVAPATHMQVSVVG